MAVKRLTEDEKKSIVGKVEELATSENLSIKEACKRLDIPYWKYYNALNSVKKRKKTSGKKAQKASKSTSAGELKVELVFKGDVAEQVREYAEAYGVEPEVVCRILIIDALKGKK